MLLYYANTTYKLNDTRGRNAHIRQFIQHSLRLGHEVWLDELSETHPLLHEVPKARFQRWAVLRKMDVIYTRLQESPTFSCRYALPPKRWVLPSALHVWEFNTIPEFHCVMGRSSEVVQESIRLLRHYGRGCDLAICVSAAMGDYVREVLGIKHIAVVPNGSDPNRFRPDVQPVASVQRPPEGLNVVWMGSADLAWHHFDLMLEAARWLSQNRRGVNILFHVIGHSFPSTEVPGNVIYHGSQPYETLPAWLAAMDVGLVLYRPGVADYNSPLKLYDYMASGLTIVATPQPQVDEVMLALKAKDLIVPFEDPVYLAEVLVRLAADPERRQRIGRMGRFLVEHYYNWERATTQIFNSIQKLQRPV
jgi:glycosyltransferase involved in cell wall biosynthesis